MHTAVLFDQISVLTPTADGGSAAFSNVFVSVRDGRLAYIGNNRAEAEKTLHGTNWQIYAGKNKLLWPAMANTHCHIPMTLFRNQTDDYNLQEWLFKVIFPREEKLKAEHVYQGTLLGLAEMIRHGTGAAADMYYFSDDVARAALESGFRLNVCCDGKSKRSDGTQHVDINLLDQFKKRWQQADGMIRVSLLVHSVYLYDAYLYREMAEAVSRLDLDVQVHVSETAREVDDCLQKYGCRPPQQLDRFEMFSKRTIAAHCVHLNDDDRRLLSERGVFIAHNPTSNLKLGSGFADVSKMLQAGLCVGLGTDGAASNNNLNLYREMQLAGLVAKGLHQDAGLLPAAELIRMATLNGMRMLGFAESGRIETGWKADLQIIDLNHAAMTPLGDPEAALVYSSSSHYVESLMVNGKWLLEKNELKTIDEEKAKALVRQYAKDLAIH